MQKTKIDPKSKITQQVLPEGTPIVIKLIHPHVEKVVRLDMELLGSISNILDRFESLEIISLPDMIREFGE